MEHIVVQGEHMAGIAEQYGYSDYRSIWDHVKNTSLRLARTSPCLLAPGDSVYIPDKSEKEFSCSSGSKQRFKLKTARPRFRMVVNGFDGKPLANQACMLEIEGVSQSLVTDSKGMLDTLLPPSASSGRLTIGELSVLLQIGFLDPIERRTGVQGRLANLGYYTGAVGDPDDAQLEFALRLFQVDHGLPVTGKLDDPTRDALRTVYGC